MRLIDEVLDRLYEKLGISKDIDFCRKYDFKPNTVSTWRKRDSIPYDKIVEISQNANISLDYILSGKEIVNNKEILNFKEETIKNLDLVNENQIKYIYYLTEAEKVKNKG